MHWILLLAVCAVLMMGQVAATGPAPVVWTGGASVESEKIKADVADVKYGPHERNVLDLYLVKSDKPTPLLVVIHGGGFSAGDKRGMKVSVLKEAREAGISVAAINYRYSTQAPAPGPFLDGARAVQFLRANAKKWNFDPERFALSGNSAGAGISLWMAFRDDLADPKNADPVLRESTRVKCVYAIAGQTSYEPAWIKANIPGDAWKHPALVRLFDLKEGELENPPAEKTKLMKEYAAIELVNEKSPPVYLLYLQDRSVPKEVPGEKSEGTIHHPKFGDLLKEKMDRLKIQCEVRVKGEWATEPTPIEFLKKHLKVE
jgi:pimeloyl-ACP methyl ester carboxylesterase